MKASAVVPGRWKRYGLTRTGAAIVSIVTLIASAVLVAVATASSLGSVVLSLTGVLIAGALRVRTPLHAPGGLASCGSDIAVGARSSRRGRAREVRA